MKRAVLLCLALAGCGGADQASFPQHVDLPTYAGAASSQKKPEASEREQPPTSSQAKPSPFPAIHDHTLKNGLSARIVEAHALPVAQIRVVVRAGMGYAAKASGSAGGSAIPGVAELTAEMLKDGGTRSMTSAQLLKRIESLGADLQVSVGLDATTVSTAVTKDHLKQALAILGEVVQAPRFDEHELAKLKSRASDQAEDRLRSSGQFMATRVMFKELFAPGAPSESPYATYGLLPSEIEKVTGAAVRDFHRRFYVPKNVSVVLVGDMGDMEAASLVDKVFGGWTGGDPPKIEFSSPIAPPRRKVVVANRPKSAQSDVFVVGLGPARNTQDWPQIRVANQVLGGGVSGRLFSDVREQRSLAYSAYSRIVELSHGEQPVVAYAGTQTEKTADAVSGLLENLEKIDQSGVTDGEVETARRYLSDVFAIRMETIGSIADMTAELWTLGLPNDYWDKYRESLRAVGTSAASSQAPNLYHPDKALIVVAGDADVIAPKLTRFGDVTVVDPEHDFATTKTFVAEDSK